MTTVGALAALISLFVLVVIQVMDRAIERILRNFAASRLTTHHRAPIIHDSDTWLPYLPRSVMKYHRYPAILSVIVCSILLIPFELITELGVDTSNRCKAVKRTGRTIAPNDASDNFTSNELASISYLLQSTEFIDGPFERIQAGIPRHISGSECLSCINGPKYPDIVSGCTVQLSCIYEANELEISIRTTNTSFKTITSLFRETKEGGMSFDQGGDVTRNGEHWASIMFQRQGETLFYLEYTDQDHIEHMFREAVRTKKEVRNVIQGTTRKYSIRCTISKLSNEHFDQAVQMYRIIQLENPVRLTPYLQKLERFAEITADTVYRAVLAMKIVDDEHSFGDYYEYTSCGVYNPIFMIPFVACIVIIIILGIISIYCSWGSNIRFAIPYTSKSWFQNICEMDSAQSDTRGRARFENLREEMVLVEEGRGIWKSKSVVVVPERRSRMEFEEYELDYDFLASESAHTRTCRSERIYRDPI